MPSFAWEGKNRQGEERKGVMEAESVADVQAKLRSQQINPSKVRRRLGDIKISISFGTGVSEKNLVVFSRQLATMVDAGLPLVQALDLLGSQEQNQAFAKVIASVRQGVEGGLTFADSLAKHPKVFDELFVNLVAAGEVGGILDTILNRLAVYIEKAAKLRSKIKGAMAYPIGVVGVAIGVTSILLWKVIPVFAGLFKNFGNKKLPELTLQVIRISDIFSSYIHFVFGGIVAIVFGISYTYRQEKGRLAIDRFLLKIPVIKSVLMKMSIARFTRTMGTLVSSGVPILDALNIAGRTAGNKVYEKAIFYVRERIAEGKSIAQPLGEVKVFPNMVVQMIAVGESTGAMDTMLSKIADFYEEEVDVAVDAMTSLIEPVMMVLLGGLVGFLMIAMYMPIFEMAGATSGGDQPPPPQQ
ncbi:MAG: type II secretion system F family protein [Myxococcales bacterium]|nr:type II secretion system F family protein [Myxococcales bacterium]